MHFIRSDAEPVDPSLVRLIISEKVVSLYTEVAILTLLVYNTVITMDKEVKYFWSSPRSFVSLIYFANRYIGVLGAISVIVYQALQGNETRCKHPPRYCIQISTDNIERPRLCLD
ncbi:hypothetical protein DFH11DRAFT_1608506 [Phellopilus nigrolimitatus]|nr:hypothetical protein DFH11DRAFT_1608506 [Phellopilus nigrolimitatus]